MRLFLTQACAYLLATLGMRFAAGGFTFGVAVTDAMLSFLAFTAVRAIAEKRGTVAQYVAGSVAGGIAGMLV